LYFAAWCSSTRQNFSHDATINERIQARRPIFGLNDLLMITDIKYMSIQNKTNDHIKAAAVNSRNTLAALGVGAEHLPTDEEISTKVDSQIAHVINEAARVKEADVKQVIAEAFVYAGIKMPENVEVSESSYEDQTQVRLVVPYAQFNKAMELSLRLDDILPVNYSLIVQHDLSIEELLELKKAKQI
jgi:hypothetical protein